MATRDLDRLGRRVKAHRLQLYPSRKAAADVAGVTKDTWQRVEEGRPAREVSYAGIDRALGWAVGSCVAIAEGGEPVLVDAADDASPALTPAPTGRLSAEAVRKAAYEAVRSTMPSAPIGEADAFVDELVEVLRRAGEVGNGD
ncbi:helix-turn-helix domain-containing protein [Streptomyces sp. NPDC001315]|uniref:helix-turn-helix domain-containing protein n=1 Tax=Streptomyces sp. NPDC001315 TaxID=3364562 RepID=UPI0036C46FB2